jgi:hypothetical protein
VIMASTESKNETTGFLTAEQEAILDKYLLQLEKYFENIKETERIQVEIETLHLKRILHS